MSHPFNDAGFAETPLIGRRSGRTAESPLRVRRSDECPSQLSDWEFGHLFFDELARRLSEIHWTPVRVARRAAELLVTSPDSHILDVGSGAGKFCIVGSLSTGARFTGVEQRIELADQSRAFLNRWDIPRVSIIGGDVEAAGTRWAKSGGIVGASVGIGWARWLDFLSLGTRSPDLSAQRA